MTTTVGNKLIGGGKTSTSNTTPKSVALGGFIISATEEAFVEVHVVSENNGSTGASYFRLRTMIVNGALIGSVQKTTIHAAAGLNATIIMSGTALGLQVTGLATSVNWSWYVMAGIK